MKQVLFPEVVWFQEAPGVRNTQYTDSGVKLLNVANLVDGRVNLSNTDRYISEEEAYGKYKHFLVDDGDFIIASSGIKVEYFDKKMGFVSGVQLPLCMNTSTIRFKVLDKNILDIRYFMYFLKTDQFKQQLSREITGSAQLNFGPSHLKKMHLPLIDLTEQRKIAAVLDKVSDLIAKRRQQLDKLDELIKARFVEMFYNIDSNTNWPVVTMADISTDMRTGPFGSALHHDEFVETGIFVLGIDNAVENKFSYNRMRYITEEKYEQLKRYTVRPGDIIITIMGTVGRSAVIPDNIPKAINTKHLACLTIDRSKAQPTFICSAFQMHPEIRQQLTGQAKGAIMDGLNLTIIKKIHFKLPPIEIQDKFVEFFNITEKTKTTISKSLEKLETLKKALMQEYFG